MNKKDTYKELKTLVPKNAAKIVIEYYGSGDSFSSFHGTTIYDADNRDITGSSNVFDIERTACDYMFDIFDQTGYVNFNNDGCAGTVTFDLDHFATTLENKSYYEAEVENPDEFF
jgi:hypothetical protein